jgi:hypothetical protein
MNLKQELAKLKEEIRTTKPKAEPLAPPAADVAVPPAAKAAAPAQKSSNSLPPANVAPPPPRPSPVKLSPPPAPPKPAKQFPPSVKKEPKFDMSEGIISQLQAEVGDLKLRIEVLEHDNRGVSEAKELHTQSQEARRLSNDLGGLIAVVSLRGGSKLPGGLSARGLGNVAVRDWSDDFTFIVGGHHYRCPSSGAQFLSPRVSELGCIDATISEMRLEVEDRDGLFGSVLEAAAGDRIAVHSVHRRTFTDICTALWNSELYQCVYPELADEVTMENVVDRLQFLSAIRCDISTELEFIASHFYDFLGRHNAVKALPSSMICEILSHRSLRLDS